MRRITLILGTILIFQLALHSQADTLWTLEKCITYALTQNIQVRKSALSTRRAEVYHNQSKAQRFPSLAGTASQNYNWNKNTGTEDSGFTGTNGSNFSFNSGVTLFNGLRLNNQIRQSELEIKSQEYSLEETKESISLSILESFLQLLYAGEQVKNSKKQIESTEEQLRLAGERLSLKAISLADYAQVKSQLASEKLILANSESQLSIARINLMQLMELKAFDEFSIAQPDLNELLDMQSQPDVKRLYETALAIKPQVRNAAIGKEIAILDEKIAKSGFYPAISANAGISTGYSTSATDIYFNQLYNGLRPNVGISLSIPIYQRKQVRTSVEIARIGYLDAELSETDIRNKLRKNIEQACLDVTSARAEYEASLEKFNATRESSNLSEEKFTQGIINSVDYLVSKTNLIVAESEFLQSKYNLIFSYKVLDFYEGKPLIL